MQSSPSGPPDWLTATPYAHRGLHGPGRLENSRAAFRAAIDAGFGIELDVQVTADGEAMVFHDYDLARLTETEGRVDRMSAAQLGGIRLKGTDEAIPALPGILDLIDCRAPLLVEVKDPRGNVAPLCRAVLAALEAYAGQAAIMSFNPEVPRWFALHAPQVIRGLVVTEQGKKGLRGRIERSLSLWRARAHFLAYDVRDLASPFVAAARTKGLPVLTWTVRTPQDEAAAAVHADQIIHELARLR